MNASDSCSRKPATTSGSTSRGWAASDGRCRSSSGETAATSRTRGAPVPGRARRPVRGARSATLRRGDRRGGADQMRELPFYTNWSYAHPRAIELAAEVAAVAPGDLNRVFFVSGGSEAIEAAWKLARQYYNLRRQAAARWKAIARNVAYHGTTMGALSINGIPALRAPFEPLVPEVRHVRNTNRYRRPAEETEEEFTALLLDDLEQAIEAAGPEQVALVIMEPVQNAGGSFTPPAGYCRRRSGAVRPLRDPAVRGRGDHRLRPGRRVVRVGALRHPARPRHVRKGLSSAYATIGAVIVARRGRRAVSSRAPRCTSHGITFGGHPVMAAIALKNLEIMRRERIVEGVREHEERSARPWRSCSSLPSSATCAGRFLLGARARQGQGDTRDIHRRGVRVAAPRLPLAAALRARPDLPGRRPGRPGDPDLTPARGRPGASSTRSLASSAKCSQRPAVA